MTTKRAKKMYDANANKCNTGLCKISLKNLNFNFCNRCLKANSNPGIVKTKQSDDPAIHRDVLCCVCVFFFNSFYVFLL